MGDTARDDSSLSETWQRRFATFDEIGLTEATYIGSKTADERKKLRSVQWNWWGLFGPLYYFAKGMWAKGLLLLTLGAAINLTLTVFVGDIGNVGTFAIMGYCLTSANLDYYRKVRFEESVWPFMPSFLGHPAGVGGSMVVVLGAGYLLLVGDAMNCDSDFAQDLAIQAIENRTGAPVTGGLHLVQVLRENPQGQATVCSATVSGVPGAIGPTAITYTATARNGELYVEVH